MSRPLRYTFMGLLLGLALVLIVRSDPGYVLLTFQGWRVESTLWVFAIVLAGGIFASIVVWRLLRSIVSAPGSIGRWHLGRKQRRTQESLEQALEKAVLGDTKAVTEALRLASKRRGDEWLKLAAIQADIDHGDLKRAQTQLDALTLSDSDLQSASVWLRAQLNYLQGEYTAANDYLAKLPEAQQSTVAVLRVKLAVKTLLADHRSVMSALATLPAGVMPNKERVARLTIALKHRLEECRTAQDILAAHQVLTKADQSHDDILLAVFAALLREGHGQQAIELASAHYKKAWPKAVLALLACAPSAALPSSPSKKLSVWLGDEANSAIGLLLQGRLAAKQAIWGTAKSHLEKSYQAQHSAFTAQCLAKVCLSMGDREASILWFERAAPQN
jgi:HemY protein